jgi:hypothetical protein
MNLSPRLLSLAAMVSAVALIGCGSSAVSSQAALGTLSSVMPQIASIPVNTSVTFTATTNEPNDVDWVLLSYSYANLGSPSVSLNGGTTYIYTAPATPPIYTGAGAYGNTQGSVTLQTSVPAGGGSFSFIQSTQTFVITAPSISVGITPATATVSLNATLLINAYAVGSVNNAVTVQVNGVTGGSTATGTLSTAGQPPNFYLYTAPAAMPMTGSTVTITVTSVADPTKSASEVITLQ